MRRICVVGMGRVGLTLALTLASVGFKVLGVERNKDIVTQLNKGKPHFYEKGLKALLEKHLNVNLAIAEVIVEEAQDAYILCVGTPINKETKKPILEYLVRATKEAAQNLKEGDLVVLRSTVPVGTTRNIVLPILRENQEQPYLVFCPERTIEGKALTELRELPQVIGGLNEASVEKALDIFTKVTSTIIQATSLEAAEMIKLMDNVCRDMYFACANEVALIAEKLGLDGFELIKAANLGYPRNNIAMPGFVGGACLEKDPYILIDSANSYSYDAKLVRLAREVNEYLPLHVAQKLKTRLACLNKDIEKAKVLIAGMAFKGQPETDDIRGSPALTLVDYLRNAHNCKGIYGHDFIALAEEIRAAGVEPCSLEDGFKNADCVIFMNNHSSYYDLDIKHLTDLMNKPAVLIDGWRIFNPEDIRELEGIIYGGVDVD